MQKIKELVAEIRKENKIQADELMAILAEAVEEEEETSEVFKVIYVKAYGEHLSKETCEEWVRCLDVTDGSERTIGEKWSMEKTSEIATRLGVLQKMNRFEFYAAMNAFYSDFFRTAKKYDADKPEFYADLVLDYFMNDADAHDKTVFAYYFNFVA